MFSGFGRSEARPPFAGRHRQHALSLEDVVDQRHLHVCHDRHLCRLDLPGAHLPYSAGELAPRGGAGHRLVASLPSSELARPACPLCR